VGGGPIPFVFFFTRKHRTCHRPLINGTMRRCAAARHQPFRKLQPYAQTGGDFIPRDGRTDDGAICPARNAPRSSRISGIVFQTASYAASGCRLAAMTDVVNDKGGDAGHPALPMMLVICQTCSKSRLDVERLTPEAPNDRISNGDGSR